MPRQYRQVPTVLRPDDVTLLIDSREQAPYPLNNFKTKRVGLQSGDYSVEGLEDLISIERKSLPDLVQCIGSGRGRFERELQRLKAYEFSCVIVECDWMDLLAGDWRGRITPNQVVGSVLAWIAKGTSFIFGHSHKQADYITGQLLWHFAKKKFQKNRFVGGLYDNQTES